MGDQTVKYRGWIKLEIPCSDTKYMTNIVKYHTDYLNKTLEQHRFNLLSVSDVQPVEEQDCEPYYEVNYEVSSHKPFDHKILNACQWYLQQLKKYCFLPYQRGNLVLHSADFWTCDLVCHLPRIPLTAVYFGNIQGGCYLNHWEVSFYTDTLRRRESSSYDRPTAVDRDGMNQLNVEFEFDKTDFMTVSFEQYENHPVKSEKDKMVKMFYQITLQRTAIRRLIVDPVAEYEKDTDQCKIHFEVNCPVFIRRGFFVESKEKGPHVKPVFLRQLRINRGKEGGQYPDDSAISDSPVFTIMFDQSVKMQEIYRILSRIRARTGVSIEFQDIPSVDIYVWIKNPYHRWTIKGGVHMSPTDVTSTIYSDFVAAMKETNRNKGSEPSDYHHERLFTITYLIECLISRGAVVKDQILLDEMVWHRFLEIVLHYYNKDDKLCEAGLEDLVHMIDGRKRIGSILKCLDRICQTRERNSVVNGLTQEERREGYQRVRKIIFTPTRVIYVAPETLMGNRVLRRYDHDGTRVLRVAFRDDDNGKMRKNKTSESLLERTARKFLRDGITVAGRDFGFLGCSNSQMRDNGAYFMEKYSSEQLSEYFRKNKNAMDVPPTYNPKILQVRQNLGRFDRVDNIPKMMARLGQCFTQSRLSGVALDRETYVTMFDLTGGKNVKRDEYTFSDGVGMMSKSFAAKVSTVMDFGKGVPSCFQFRFRGMKGVIAIEPLLDDIRQWAITNKVPKPSEGVSWGMNCVFRPSQIKFIAKRYEKEQIEIVKFSAPVPVALNKPFINILDQVSELQSLKCHRRMTNRVEVLLDRQMISCAKQLYDEVSCRNKLKELPRRVDIDFLKTTWGFTLSSEPFFRSLIKASIKFSITRQLRKEQIPIPHELGRSMLGVVDETGRLQYGQIFVQYTKNLALKLPPPTAARQVLTGKVLLTKNPCIVAGDVRVFEAVDIPELHHMCDVVVFPQHGPRPHPDEMAGSDLDGDEYSVIWDQEMLLDRNESPFDFTAEKQKVKFEEDKIDELMRDFYIEYIKLDSVGTISNNHLHCSDQYGLNAKVCMDLAKKNCQAVDFTKSGQPPAELEKKWRKDPITEEMLPPERAERVPDYHMGNDHTPMYVSPRLCGKLFREFKAIDDVLKISEERDEQLEITIDESIRVSGYMEYMQKAREELARYNAQLRSIMENYGIRTEGEIYSGCIADMRNRISDKDQDDMSFYNTGQMIETKVTNLFKKYRELFFEEFGGYTTLTEPMQRANDDSNVLQRQCKEATNEMMKKAVAWYRACYEEAVATRENKKLSFAWTVYDVIGIVKQNSTLNSNEIQIGGTNPLYTMLQEHRKQYLDDNKNEFERFKRYEFAENKNKQVQIAVKILDSYLKTYPNLDIVIFILCEWAQRGKLFDAGPIQIHQFALLFILFGTGQFTSVDGNVAVYFDKHNEDKTEESEQYAFSEEQMSVMIVKFFEFLSSRKFRRLSYLSFQPINLTSIYMRGEWQCYHVAALKTYYNILFNLRFEELPVSTDPTITVRSIIRENEPFVIELPSTCDIRTVVDHLKYHTGVQEIQMRQMEKSVNTSDEAKPNVRLLVSTRGTLESMYKLRQLVAVKVPIKTYVTGQEISTQMARLCYEKIMTGQFNAF